MNKEIEWIDVNLFPDDDIEEIEDEEHENYFDKERDDMMGRIMLPKFGKLIQTPLGPMMMDDTFHPLRNLPVKICHINFPITPNIMNALDKVVGIEFFKLVGRYRLLFIFGKLFDVDTVIEDIERVFGITSDFKVTNIDVSTFNVNVQDVIKEITSNITSDHWIAYVFPNRKYRLENLGSAQEVTNKYSEYELLFNDSQGLILTSNDVTG